MSTLSWTKEARIYNGEKKASSINGARKTGQLHIKEWIRTIPNTIYKKTSKWIKDLNVNAETIKLLEEDRGKTLFDINHSNILSDWPTSESKGNKITNK